MIKLDNIRYTTTHKKRNKIKKELLQQDGSEKKGIFQKAQRRKYGGTQ